MTGHSSYLIEMAKRVSFEEKQEAIFKAMQDYVYGERSFSDFCAENPKSLTKIYNAFTTVSCKKQIFIANYLSGAVASTNDALRTLDEAKSIGVDVIAIADKMSNLRAKLEYLKRSSSIVGMIGTRIKLKQATLMEQLDNDGEFIKATKGMTKPEIAREYFGVSAATYTHYRAIAKKLGEYKRLQYIPNAIAFLTAHTQAIKTYLESNAEIAEFWKSEEIKEDLTMKIENVDEQLSEEINPTKQAIIKDCERIEKMSSKDVRAELNQILCRIEARKNLSQKRKREQNETATKIKNKKDVSDNDLEQPVKKKARIGS
eukprot:TRINITY_DN8159_c0_g1_i1.p1 TRINITY_DN8159_c0_g1~~TRINITY_DN8159_c0_g1_i1.p1  ORF type:complete len:316 (-),score=65.34 TRINITY_DN8159_c0_g1_i1:68-1015(-)